MREIINEKINVVTYFNAIKGVATPYIINWQNQDYKINQLGYHHKVYQGNTLHHIFEVTSQAHGLSFRLNLDTNNMHWTLETVSDGHPN